MPDPNEQPAYVQMLDHPDRHKVMVKLFGELANTNGGMTFLAFMIALPLIDAARSLDRIATHLTAVKEP